MTLRHSLGAWLALFTLATAAQAGAIDYQSASYDLSAWVEGDADGFCHDGSQPVGRPTGSPPRCTDELTATTLDDFSDGVGIQSVDANFSRRSGASAALNSSMAAEQWTVFGSSNVNGSSQGGAFATTVVEFSLDSLTEIAFSGLLTQQNFLGYSFPSDEIYGFRLESAATGQALFNIDLQDAQWTVPLDYDFPTDSYDLAEDLSMAFDPDLVDHIWPGPLDGSKEATVAAFRQSLSLEAGAYRLVASYGEVNGGFDDLSAGSRTAFRMSVVPVPPALLLFPSALAALGWWRRRVQGH